MGGGGVARHSVGVCGKFFIAQQDFLHRLGLFRAVGDKALAQHNCCALDGLRLDGKRTLGKRHIVVRVCACIGGGSDGILARVFALGACQRNTFQRFTVQNTVNFVSQVGVFFLIYLGLVVRGDGDFLDGDGCSGFGLISAFSQHIVGGRIAAQLQIGDDNILLACLSLFKHTLSRNGQLVVFQNTVKLGIAVIQHSIGIAVKDFVVCRNAGNGNSLRCNHKLGGRISNQRVVTIGNRCRNRVAACINGNSCVVVVIAGIGQRHRNVFPVHSAGKFRGGGGDTAVSAAVRGNSNGDFLGGDGGSGLGLIPAFSQHIVSGRIAAQRQIGNRDFLLTDISAFHCTCGSNG